MRMMTNNLSLVQMNRMIIGINELRKHNLPFISVITSPTTGGTSASIVPIADIILAESKNAVYGFAGKRIVESSSSEPLPEKFQTAQWALQNGQIDKIVDRKDLKDTLYTLLSILLKQNADISSVSDETSEDINSITKAAS